MLNVIITHKKCGVLFVATANYAQCAGVSRAGADEAIQECKEDVLRAVADQMHCGPMLLDGITFEVREE